MSSVDIKEISIVNIKVGDKLIVRLPEYSSNSDIKEIRESLALFFGMKPNNIFVYSGNVSFSKVTHE